MARKKKVVRKKLADGITAIIGEDDPPEREKPEKPPHKHQDLRYAVRFFYDLQRMRCGTNGRATQVAHGADLAPDDATFLSKMGTGLASLEKDALKEIKQQLKKIPIYTDWLLEQKGVGPTLAGVLISEIDITRCNSVSAMWAYCGLAVVDGHAARLVRGQKAKFSPFLKAKLLKVMADCLIKANSPWRSYYDNYKHRKKNQLVDVCMACEGLGHNKKTGEVCANCGGNGGPAPWGKSDMHRNMAARRYMVKMLLLHLWPVWREIEGLPVRVPYAEEYLNRVHHG